MIEVIHKRDMVAGDIYVARACYGMKGSLLANPFKIGEHGSREEVIRLYEEWLDKQIEKRGIIYKELIKLVYLYRENPNIRLACWCAPKPCHADVIARKVIELDRRIE